MKKNNLRAYSFDLDTVYMDKAIVVVKCNFNSGLLIMLTAIRMCERGSANLQLEKSDFYNA